ncbi:hypothetical protein BB559_004290 [Furculomyces boomerangus]|uniref:Extracellular membrane protein CFEM domain-containing protein n=2 Tax=Harpellales TaxID=61421 RepID=A0A2T9YFH7_9FUNG|nr:hypothetical protein BB559_004290 [Furculomyces boomerangus]PVZ98915.1 hypothetical protein BB558_005051 [Smittium angustum]
MKLFTFSIIIASLVAAQTMSVDDSLLSASTCIAGICSVPATAGACYVSCLQDTNLTPLRDTLTACVSNCSGKSATDATTCNNDCLAKLLADMQSIASPTASGSVVASPSSSTSASSTKASSASNVFKSGMGIPVSLSLSVLLLPLF